MNGALFLFIRIFLFCKGDSMSPRKPRSSRYPTILLGFCLLMLSNCSKEKLDEFVEKSKGQLSQGVDQLKQRVDDTTAKAGQAATSVADETRRQLDLAGSMALTLDRPITVAACFASFIPGADGRPSVLKLQTSRSADNETFPSMLLQAVVPVQAKSELGGQTVTSRLYVQLAADGPIWVTADSDPVQLRITAVDDKQVVAELVGGTLVPLASGATVVASGKFTGVF